MKTLHELKSHPYIKLALDNWRVTLLLAALIIATSFYFWGYHRGYHQGICDLAQSIAGPEIIVQVCH